MNSRNEEKGSGTSGKIFLFPCSRISTRFPRLRKTDAAPVPRKLYRAHLSPPSTLIVWERGTRLALPISAEKRLYDGMIRFMKLSFSGRAGANEDIPEAPVDFQLFLHLTGIFFAGKRSH